MLDPIQTALDLIERDVRGLNGNKVGGVVNFCSNVGDKLGVDVIDPEKPMSNQTASVLSTLQMHDYWSNFRNGYYAIDTGVRFLGIDELTSRGKKLSYGNFGDIGAAGQSLLKSLNGLTLNEVNSIVLYVRSPTELQASATSFPCLLSVMGKLPSLSSTQYYNPTIRLFDEDGSKAVNGKYKVNDVFYLNGGGTRAENFVSTSVAHNVFGPSYRDNRAMFLIYGGSGVRIGGMGEHSSVDGLEVLYSPTTIVKKIGEYSVKVGDAVIATIHVLLELEQSMIGFLRKYLDPNLNKDIVKNLDKVGRVGIRKAPD